MEYIISYFGKNLEELSYQDISDFFSEEREESDKIEFKSFSSEYGNINKNLEGVIRGICALINSNGGILIWGAPQGIKIEGRDEKVFIGDLSPVNERREKDWLINKISDSITPLPININVQILEENNNFVYVFEVDPSDYKPHQYKNTYWARLDGQTKQAPHYLIESLFRQVKFPNIEGYIKLNNISTKESKYILDFTIFIFNFSELQNEENLSFRLMCPQGLFVRANYPGFENLYGFDGHELIYTDQISVLHFGAPNMRQELLEFDPYNPEVDLVLSFGGKKSPMKTSFYKINLNGIDWNKPESLSHIIVEKEVNITMAKKQEELGTSKEETLKSILGE